jgi:hypothetical protein
MKSIWNFEDKIEKENKLKYNFRDMKKFYGKKRLNKKFTKESIDI